MPHKATDQSIINSENYLKQYATGFDHLIEIASDYERFEPHLNHWLQERPEKAKFIQKMWVKHLKGLQEFIREEKTQDYSNEIVVNLKKRLDVYLGNDYLGLLDHFVPLASQMVGALGPEVMQTSTPLLKGLRITRFSNTLVKSVFNLVVCGLVFLSGYVIYNLMLVSVDSRSYETAVQRVIGLSQPKLIGMMVFNGFCYSVLGVLVAVPITSRFFTYVNDELLIPEKVGFTLEINPISFQIAAGIAMIIP
jgi:ABC-type antimicrobial peptide transport system permease subunit